MSAKTTFLTLISQFLLFSFANRTCVPYSHYLENGRLCVCDSNGKLNETDCHMIGRRRQMCPSGQIIWEGCNQCICQENGHLSCTRSICPDEANNQDSIASEQHINSSETYTTATWCTPYRSYYLNCTICVCPPSAQLQEAKCAVDRFCKLEESNSFNRLVTGNNVCIPNVMYFFPCLQCLCTDGGFFSLDKCVATCLSNQQSQETCTPRSFFKKDCNVCWCPEDSVVDEKYCTHTVCNKTVRLKMLNVERRQSNKCMPNTFTKPKCFYCICSDNGKINEKACLELDCLKKHNQFKDTCQPGELVSICIQCLCLGKGQTYSAYCSKSCTTESRLELLHKVLDASISNDSLLDRNVLRSALVNDFCQPFSVYKRDHNYCVCPETGNVDKTLCAEIPGDKDKTSTTPKAVDEDSNLRKCEPHTFVQIDCNTCYCSKNGTIDPRWCTYDDCEAKRIISKGQKTVMAISNSDVTNTCTPGTILKRDCNFCICPNNGSYFGRMCTKNACESLANKTKDEIITCDPLTYFVVDCNTCLCPEDGIKNVEKCTKNICEKPFMRSSSCEPGSLFSDECNVCVCPPNGDRANKVCTNHTCSEVDAPWKRIFKISQNLLSNQPNDQIKQLDVCFPGEELTIGCKVCVCPDIGLKAYATCTPMQCDDKNLQKTNKSRLKKAYAKHRRNRGGLRKRKRSKPRPTHPRNKPRSAEINVTEEGDGSLERCVEFDTRGDKKKQMLPNYGLGTCTPGTMYILNCKECICPHGHGDIMYYCRPRTEYCEQAYPNVDFIPVLGRKNIHQHAADVGLEVLDITAPHFKHNHTIHKCYKSGKIVNECFVCQCEEQHLVVIEEHCFKNELDKCDNVAPDFLKQLKSDDNK